MRSAINEIVILVFSYEDDSLIVTIRLAWRPIRDHTRSHLAIDLSDFCLWNTNNWMFYNQIIQLSNFLCFNLFQMCIISNVDLCTITYYMLRQKLRSPKKIMINALK